MRKVFLPIQEGSSGNEDETVYIEKYWTDIWNDVDLKNSVKLNIQKRDEFKIISKYIQRLPKNARILDGGCGVGNWTIFFALKGFDITGLDISSKVIGRLKQIFPEQSQRFFYGDIRETRFNADYFDAYFSWGVFEHFENGLGDCFREAHRILKKGGFLFVTVPFQNYRHRLKDTLEKRRKNDQERMRFYQYKLTKAELRTEFEKYNFHIQEIRQIHKLFGIHRLVVNDLHLSSGSFGYKLVKYSLYPFLPTDYVAHMILGVGVKE